MTETAHFALGGPAFPHLSSKKPDHPREEVLFPDSTRLTVKQKTTGNNSQACACKRLPWSVFPFVIPCPMFSSLITEWQSASVRQPRTCSLTEGSGKYVTPIFCGGGSHTQWTFCLLSDSSTLK